MERYEKYKDSGVEWIGEIPNDWELLRLKYASEIIGRIGFRGYTIADIVEKNLGAISLSPSNISNQKLNLDECTYISWEKYDESPEIQIFPRDIVMVKTGSTIGKVAIIPDFTDKITINPQLVVLKNLKLDPKFIYYTITSRYFQSLFVIYSAGGSTPAISQEKMNNFSFVAPPSLTEQTAIANYLDKKTSELDALITKKEKLIELLKEERTAIINQAVTKGLNQDVEMKDSGVEWLDIVPKHWKVKRLKYLGEAIGGLTYSPNQVVESSKYGKLVLRSSNIQKGKLELNDNVYVNMEISEKLTLKKGDILICSRNGSRHLIGKNICIDERTAGQTFGAFMMIFRAEEWRFLYYFFNSQIFSSQSSLFLSATINQLTAGTINSFLIAIPNSFEEQTAIAEYLDKKTTELDLIVSKTNQEITLLKEYKTALIAEVVTGKVKVF